MNSNKSVECIAPFSSLFITNSKVGAPCCVIKHKNRENIDFNKDLNWNFNSVNGNYRKEFLSFGNDFEKYTECQACYLPPGTTNAKSQKDLHNEEAVSNLNYIQNPTVTNLHLKFSNLCNLACRMCDPYSSNLLFKDRDDFYINENLLVDSNKVITNIPKNSVLYQSIIENLPNINRLWFSGGETLLHDEVWEILRNLYNSGHSKNVSLQLNTNGTVKLSPEEIDILKSFKKLTLHISIDGVGDLAEYIRTNLNWNSWIENFKVYSTNFKKENSHDFALVTTVSTFNIHKLKEIRKFFQDNFKFDTTLNFVHGPWPETVGYNINQRAKDYLLEIYRDDEYYGQVESYLRHAAEIDSNTIAAMIDTRDDKIIKNKIYKNHRAFREIEPDWYKLIS